MKKSVIILIGIIYILGIVLVNSFGLQVAEYQSKVYVDSIQFTNDGIEIQDNGNEKMKKVNVYMSENPTYQLEWEYTPDDATETDVVFTCDKNSTVGTVDEKGLVTFNKKGILIVYIRTVDGSSKSDSITIIVR